VITTLPVAHRTIRVEYLLREFLLEGMLMHRRLIDLDTQAGPVRGGYGAILHIQGVRVLHHVRAPRHILADGFANDVIGLGKSKFE
jgi:hypothetical protein